MRTAASDARDISMDEMAGFSSDEEQDHLLQQMPWRETAPRKSVGSSRRKRDHAHISQSSSTLQQAPGGTTSKKKARASSSGRSPSLPPPASVRRISPRDHPSSTQRTGAKQLSSQPSRSRSIGRSHSSSQNKHHLRLPQHHDDHSRSPDRPHGPATTGALTSTLAISASEQGIARRPADMRHRDSLAESTVTTTTSTGGNNHHRYMLPSTTNTTGTTEVMSNVHLKRRADFGSEESQSMLFDDYHQGDSCFNNSSSRKAARRRPPASLHSSFNRRSFLMDVDNPFFALLETIEPSSCREDHRLRILHPQTPRPEHELPPVQASARMLELPAEALHGVWAAELKRGTYGGAPTPTRDSRMSLEEIATLDSCTLSLRHHSRAGLLHLRNYHSGYGTITHASNSTSNRSSDHAFLPVASATGSPMDPETLNVSIVHPRWTRQTQMDSQRVVTAVERNHQEQQPEESSTTKNASSAKTETTAEGGFFIAGVSVVGFTGFTCSGDLNTNASKVSSTILEGLEDNDETPDSRLLLSSRSTTPSSKQPPPQSITCPSLLGIAGATRPIGVSVLCELELSSDYLLWIAQDLTKKDSPIVAIDVTFSDPSASLATPADRSGKVVSSNPTSSMSARDSTGDDSDGPLQELSELNLRAHTQSVGKTEYDPFQRLWAPNKQHNKRVVGFATNNNRVRPMTTTTTTTRNVPLPPNRSFPRATQQAPIATEQMEINQHSSTPDDDSTRATYHNTPRIAYSNHTKENRLGPEQDETFTSMATTTTDPMTNIDAPPVDPSTKLFVSNNNRTTPEPESPDSLSPLNHHQRAVLVEQRQHPNSSSSRILIPRISTEQTNIHYSDTRLASRRRGDEDKERRTSNADTRNGESTRTTRHHPSTKSTGKTSLNAHRFTGDRRSLEEGFSESRPRAFSFHGASLLANEVAARQRPLEAPTSVADFLREQLRSHSSAAAGAARSTSQSKTLRKHQHATRRITARIAQDEETWITRDESPFSSPITAFRKQRNVRRVSEPTSYSGDAAQQIGQDDSPFSTPIRQTLSTSHLTISDGTNNVMGKGDKGRTPSSTYRRGCRHSGIFSSLRMVLLVVWSLLTWTATTPAPPNFWADLLLGGKEIVGFPEVFLRSTPTLASKRKKNSIPEQVSRFISGRNEWRMEDDAAIVGSHNRSHN